MSDRVPARRPWADTLRAGIGQLPKVAQRAFLDASWFLPLWLLFQLFLLRGAFRSGILADIDSVCHVAYLRHLTEEFYPATHHFFGFSPTFNGGAPFLVYNIPPGTYIAGFLLVKIGLSAELALKVLLAAAYLSIPISGWYLARSLAPKYRVFPPLAAIFLSLFSSDLYGLEFYFKNGMINPALALAVVLATWVVFRRACAEGFPRNGAWLALAALLFAGITLTHILSSYFLALTLGADVLGGRRDRMGRRAVAAGVVLALGGGAVAFWLLPSTGFAPAEDPAYIWIRNPKDTLSAFFDGSLLASYLGGFSPSYRAVNNVGVVPVYLALIGGIEAFRKKDVAMRGVTGLMLVCLLLVLGPTVTFGTQFLPGYSRLLWFRFLTPLAYSTFLLAAYGAARICSEVRLGPAPRWIVAGGIVLGIYVLGQRSSRIKTAEQYPDFLSSYVEVRDWLREHGDKKRKIFSEFMAFGTEEPPSINYTRQLLPVDTGVPELAGWVYENNAISRRLIKQGTFWYAPLLLADDVARWNLGYILASSPQTVHALSEDSRFRRVVTTNNLVLFEAISASVLATARDAAPAGASELPLALREAAYRSDGGYRYLVDVPAHAATTVTLRTNGGAGWSAIWRGSKGDSEVLPAGIDEDGRLTVALPAQEAGQLEVIFSLGKKAELGSRLSIVSLVALSLLGAASMRRRRLGAYVLRLRDVTEWSGRGALVVTAIGCIYQGRAFDASKVGFGVTGGMSASRDPHDASVEAGTVNVQGASVVQKESGGKNWLLRLGPKPSLIVATKTGTWTGKILRKGVTCLLAGAAEAVAVPRECLIPSATEGPGIEAELVLDAVPIGIQVRDEIRYVQAEEFRNVLDDGGYDALPMVGHPAIHPQNGILLDGVATKDRAIALTWQPTLPNGRYQVYLLRDAAHPRHRRNRADFTLSIAAEDLGTVAGVEPNDVSDFWRTSPRFAWGRFGDVQIDGRPLRLSWRKAKDGSDAWGSIDAFAFVPVSE
jgi:hypothetical protein